MKKIALTFLLFVAVNLSLVAQIDKLAEQVAENNKQMVELSKQMAENTKQIVELNKQMIEFAKQQAVANVEIKNLDKRFDSVDKRFDTQTSYMIAIFAGIFGMMALVMWDRRAANKPYEEKTEKLQAEITLLKEKELRHEEKTEAYFKKIAQIDARFTAIL